MKDLCRICFMLCKYYTTHYCVLLYYSLHIPPLGIGAFSPMWSIVLRCWEGSVRNVLLNLTQMQSVPGGRTAEGHKGVLGRQGAAVHKATSYRGLLLGARGGFFHIYHLLHALFGNHS